MLGGLGAYIASEVSGSVKRNLTVYGLYALGGLLVICACGYGLDALHTLLTLRLGAIAASLWIGGGLLVAALASFGAAAYVKNRKRPSRPLSQTALVAAPLAMKFFGSRTVRSKFGWRAAMLGGVVVLGTLLGRQFFSGGDSEEDA